MKRLNIIFYILFLNSCGLFLDQSIEQKPSESDTPIDELIAIEDSLLTIQDSDFQYPTLLEDLFLLIPTQRSENKKSISLDLKSYIYSNKMNIDYADNNYFEVNLSNDSLLITPNFETNELKVLPVSVNGIDLDLLVYSSFTKEYEDYPNQKNIGIILKDSFFINSNSLILDFIYLSGFSENKDLKMNTTFILFNNSLLPERYYHIFENRIRIMLPENMNNGFLRICSMDNNGFLLRENQTIISDGAPLSPIGNEASPYFSNKYYLTVDRFNDASSENNMDIDFSVDEKVRFHGGDLTGVLSKIDNGYFSRLGIKELLISPIAKNPDSSYRSSYLPHRKHMSFDGKFTINSREIDPRYGQNQNLREIIKASHSQEIGVSLEHVIGYTHLDHLYYKSSPKWYELNEDTQFLGSLNFQDNEVIQQITSDIMYWINEFNLDGIKYSSFDNTSIEFWRHLNRLLYLENHILSNKINSQFDFQANIDLYNKGREHFSGLNTDFYNLNLSIYNNLVEFSPINLLETSTGLEDQVRFISVADGQATFNDTINSKLFINSPGDIENPVSYEKLFMFHVMNNVLPGIPTIFYGDEYGQVGAGGVDSKRDMKFQNQLTILESHLKSRISKLNSLRSQYPSLSLGDFFILRESTNHSVWLKSYYNEKILIFFNLQDKTIEVNVPLPFKSKRLVSLTDDQVIDVNDKNIIGLVVPPYKTGIFLAE